MTDLEILVAASQAAHAFFDEVAAGGSTIEDADTAVFNAYHRIAPPMWWLCQSDQLLMFRYHFNVKLFALGLRPAAPTPAP